MRCAPRVLACALLLAAASPAAAQRLPGQFDLECAGRTTLKMGGDRDFQIHLSIDLGERRFRVLASSHVGRLADVDAGRITIFRTVGAPPGETFESWVNLTDLTYHDVAHARLAVMDRGTTAACRRGPFTGVDVPASAAPSPPRR